MWDGGLLYDFNFSPTKPEGYVYWVNNKTNEILAKAPFTHMEKSIVEKAAETFEAGTYLDVEGDTMDMLALNGHWWSNDGITDADLKAAGLTTKDDLKGTLEYMAMKEEMWGDSAKDVATVILRKGWGAETFEAPYGGAGALMDIGKDTPLADFTGKELAESSAIHGDFDQASLNYSGHQNLEVRAEMEFDYDNAHEAKKIFPNIEHWKNLHDSHLDYTEGGDLYDEAFFVDIPNMKIYSVKFYFEDSGSKKAVEWAEEKLGVVNEGIAHDKFNYDPSNPSGYLYYFGERSFSLGEDKKGNKIELFKLPYMGMEITESDKSGFKMAEMDIVAKGMAVVSNTNNEMVGVVEVVDDKDDDEMVELSIQDENMDEIGSFTLDDGAITDDFDDYLAENTIVKEAKKRPVLTSLAAIAGTVLLWPHLKTGASKVFGADVATSTQEVLENDPELIETPSTGDLDPAQYEELVVESTGYAVDVIPQGLDGSFMGSRFAALPTERYVRYSDPGIGAHTDIALNRDEIHLEPEMAMVQASENVVKEAQAPGQSPYNSTTGEENPDFDYRVLKETTVISLDPAVKPFIPQSMAGYTGNANTPPSVYNKMFNIGVLGQTPLFVAGQGDMGSSHTGSRNAIPDSLGIAGSVGGPLSDKVNANYTDGTTSMSLAQWAIENTVSQTSDTEAVVIDRSSGAMKRVRRV